MIKILLFTIFFFLYSFGVEISKTKTFTTIINPTLKQSTFNLSIEDVHSDNIEKRFNQVSKLVKQHNICKGGEYNIYPFSKTVDKAVFKGYRSNISFNCSFEDNNKYENLLNDIKKLNFDIFQNSIKFIPTVEQVDKAKIYLEKEAFNYAKEYIKNLNTYFEDCKLMKIGFVEQQGFNNLLRAAAYDRSTTVTEPIDNEVKITLDGDFTFVCE